MPNRGGLRNDGPIMTAFLVLLFPLLLMLFALTMSGVEARLHTATMSENDVEEFFESAHPDEVNTLITQGWAGALDRFRLRRRRRSR